MPEPINPRRRDNPSSYFVEDSNNDAEMIRLMIQDQLVTAGMGGPLAEQPDPAALQHILDIGCGPGGWILETAARYPHMSLMGIDISWRMIEYAQAQAQAQRLTDGVQFRVMDATKRLDFSDASFELVNMRFGSSFLLAKDWPTWLHDVLRVIRPGGILRLVEAGEGVQSTSPAHMRLSEMLTCAMYRSGRHFTPGNAGIAPFLPQLLTRSGYQHVQTKEHTLEYLAGTAGGQNFYQNMMYVFQTGLPFLRKWDCATQDYDAVYQQAMIEMQQKDFRATWNPVTTWGTK